MSTDPLDIGLSALEAYGLGVDVAANNLANVDMAGEIIKMTASQKAYEANAKSVRTSDQMLNVAINLDDEGRTA